MEVRVFFFMERICIVILFINGLRIFISTLSFIVVEVFIVREFTKDSNMIKFAGRKNITVKKDLSFASEVLMCSIIEVGVDFYFTEVKLF